jgi:Excalibur calcium-binding domain
MTFSGPLARRLCQSEAGLTVELARATIPAPWKNCTNVHKKYPHGVGKLHARDRTSGTPVTTFKRGTRLYNIAMSYNKRLDADKDGIACEKR